MKPDLSTIPARPRVIIEGRYVPQAMKDRVLSEQDHVCARSWCEQKAVDVDHIMPLWNSGSNKRENLEGLCTACHGQKTQAEATMRARAKRLAGETCTGPRKAIPKRPSGGFPPKGSRKLATKRKARSLPADGGERETPTPYSKGARDAG